MDNKEDWKKLEQYMENRNAEMMSKYKIDINQDIGKRVAKTDRNMKIIKKVMIIIIVILIYCVIYSVYNVWASAGRKSRLQLEIGTMVTETAIRTDIFGNGCYSYKIPNLPGLEIHSWFVIYKDIFIEDSDERFCKYYFENWNDKDKNKFVVNESYDDCSGLLYKKKNWILNYQIYIEANTYEDAMNAIDVVIKFQEYAQNRFYFDNNVYIKIGENRLFISNNQSSETMRQYLYETCVKLFGNTNS